MKRAEILFLLTLSACGSNDDGETSGLPSSVLREHPMPSEIAFASEALEGYWVWTHEVADGTITRTITEADLATKVGSTGWEGCPNGILCTHYGIRRIAFTSTGKSFYGVNVVTSSDWNYLSTFTAAEGVIKRTSLETYSCAHPNDDNQNVTTTFAGYRREGDALWISDGQSKELTSPPAQESGKWTVYRKISAEEFFGRYRLVDTCYADRSSRGSCHAACKAEPTPLD